MPSGLYSVEYHDHVSSFTVSPHFLETTNSLTIASKTNDVYQSGYAIYTYSLIDVIEHPNGALYANSTFHSMDCSIIKHQPRDRAEYVGCVDYKFCEWPEHRHWLWTNGLSRNCFAVVIITTKVGVLFHCTSKPPDGQGFEISSSKDMYMVYLEELFDSFKKAWCESKDVWANARMFFIVPTHAYSDTQNNALEWFLASIERETTLVGKRIVYVPRNIKGWATIEVCHETGGDIMPRVFVNAEAHNPAVPLFTQAAHTERNSEAV